MRIIAGTYRGRALTPPPDLGAARPITDRVKEALFSILREQFEDANVVDLFAGTGTVGLEAISRGARSCLFVERDKQMLRILEENINRLGAQSQARVFPGDALGPAWLARSAKPVRIVFLDPPYAMSEDNVGRARLTAQMSRIGELVEADGFVILRTPTKLRADLSVEGLDGPETRVYGSTALQIYARVKADP
ncbi:MAG: 16S rRNA (guanine(966)-N(2))-methyltransferase RsmD [Phycisphaerales bacterium]|nr:16S rRNA (guanine(966)-N(2))-methyltransferase RsmD [Phycisphaerales bacterium]